MKEVKVAGIWIWLSVFIAFLVTTTSLLGIFDSRVYFQETANWALQARGQDIGNLIAVPVFLASTYFLIKRSIKAYLLWTGILMYFIYAYIIYCFALHFNTLFLIYVAILGMSVYSLLGGVMGKDFTQITKTISLNSKVKASGIFLIVLGILFGFLWLIEIIPAILSGHAPSSFAPTGLWVNPVHVIDLSTVLPGMIIAGVLLLKKKDIGFLFTAPWLIFSVLMGSSIVVTMIMMVAQGSAESLPPLIMMGLIVVLSLIFLILYTRELN